MPFVSHDGSRQRRTGRFQMALHPHLHLSLRREPRRIDDGLANFLARTPVLASQRDVLLSVAVASLTVDSFWNAGENRRRPGRGVLRGNSRIGVMAKHAVVGNRAQRALMIRPIIA